MRLHSPTADENPSHILRTEPQFSKEAKKSMKFKKKFYQVVRCARARLIPASQR